MFHEDQVQQELINKVLQACHNVDLPQLKKLLATINLYSDYHQQFQTSKLFFQTACLSNNLDILSELSHLPMIFKEKSPIFNDVFKTLISLNNPENYHVISYLLNSPNLEPLRDDSFKFMLYKTLIDVAQVDNIALFKILLNLDEDKEEHKGIFSIHYGLLDSACFGDNIDVFKYLYAYRQSKYDDNKDYGFEEACDNRNINILKFLIFEKQITRTKQVNEEITRHNSYEAIKLFEARDLYGELKHNQEKVKKIKV